MLQVSVLTVHLVRRMGVKKFLWPRFSYLWSASALSLLRYREQPLALRGTQHKASGSVATTDVYVNCSE